MSQERFSATQRAAFAAAALGWLFDTMDQRLFILARGPALGSLSGSAGAQGALATQATSLFIAGWATGGLVFGVVGDRWGRRQTMAVTIAIYSLFTGLTAFAVSPTDFAAYRFLTGLGIGGEFAAGVALVAEVIPGASRPRALGLLQAFGIVGTFLGTALSFFVKPEAVYFGDVPGWRLLFAIGFLPALLLLLLRRGVRESEAWTAARDANERLGGFRVLFTDPRWRVRSVGGMLLGLAGQLGVWGIGTWTPELIRAALGPGSGDIARTGLLLKDIAAFGGVWAFSLAAERFGRKPAFFGAFVASIAAIAITFSGLRTERDVYWTMPLLGFTVWSVLAGYAIYFPELYPTRLRSSGTGLCYNVARYLTAGGVMILGRLVETFRDRGYAQPLRPAAIALSAVYLVGLAALVVLPETKGEALPE
jgi:predicted MFS family arabinose efflux permease